MKKLEQLLEKKGVVALVLLLLAIPTLLPLFSSGYFSTQDFIYIARIEQMKVALTDFHFPVRWAPDFRYGEPLYNFYAPLPYYFAALIKIATDLIMLNLTYLVLSKILFATAFLASTYAMYLLAKRLFGIYGGITAAILYLYAPYHSVDLYVRGAISEGFALICFPLIFLSIMKFAETKSTKWFGLTSLSLASLFFTHNIMTLLFSPFILLWMGYWTLKKGWNLALPMLLTFGLGVGLASTYLLPAFFEKNFVQSSGLTSGYFDFRGHFISIKQWFYSPWGYGASLWGDDDDMSFMLGATHWISFFISGLLLLLVLLHKKLKSVNNILNTEVYANKKQTIWLILFSSVIGFSFLFSLFMSHTRSAIIWETFSVLAFTQFPWRFLGISIFFASLFGGLMIYILRNNLKLIASVLIIIATIIVNIPYFKPDIYFYDATDKRFIDDVFANEDRIPRDYVPTTTKDVQRPHLAAPEFKYGTGVINDFSYKTANVSLTLFSASESAILELPVTYFPGWAVKKPKDVVTLLEPDKYGLIQIQVLGKGTYQINLHFGDTPIRVIGNTISLFSLLILTLLFALQLKKRKKNK